MKNTDKLLINIITGEKMQPGDFEYDWQEFVLKRLRSIDISDDVGTGVISYNLAFLDALRLALKLNK